jgi:hypothetical protein
MNGKLEWFKSSFSANGQSCVECARTPGGGMVVRDTKDPDGPVLKFTAQEWQAFLAGVRNDEFE